jgi:hypothetical protein
MPPARLSVVLRSIVGAYNILDNIALSRLLYVRIRSDAADESDSRKLRWASGGKSAGEGGRGERGAAEGGCEERHGGWECAGVVEARNSCESGMDKWSKAEKWVMRHQCSSCLNTNDCVCSKFDGLWPGYTVDNFCRESRKGAPKVVWCGDRRLALTLHSRPRSLLLCVFLIAGNCSSLLMLAVDPLLPISCKCILSV